MSLLQSIDAQLKSAMLSKDDIKCQTLRFLKSSIKYAAIEKKQASLDDAQIISVVQKLIKQRRESIEQFEKGGRLELAQKETQEAQILETFLPAQLNDTDLEKIVKDAVLRLGATSKKDFGRVMKELAQALSGQADASRISQKIGQFLS